MVDGFDIELYVYEPQSEVRTRGVIQLVHGSCEHAKRYEQFISYLLELGYVVSRMIIEDMENLSSIRRIMGILVKPMDGLIWSKI